MIRPCSVSKLLFVLFYLTLIIQATDAQVIPSDEWVNFYSRHTIFHGAPVAIGGVIDAFDPDGSHCGTFTVTKPGQYGFLLVYRDDGLTPNVDEGAAPGDTITFKINGVPVKVLGPDPRVWTQKGDIWEVDLADNLSPVKVDSIADVVMIEDAPDTIIADLDYLFSDPEQDSLRFSAMSHSSGILPTIDPEQRLHISLVPNWSGRTALVITAQDKWFQIRDTIAIQVLEINDPPVIKNLPDTSFSSDTTLTIDLNPYVEDVDHPRASLSWQAAVQPAYEDSLLVIIDNTNKLATFSARYIFSAPVEVVFTVTDDSSGFDLDTIIVQVKFPAGIAGNANFSRPINFSLSQNHPNPFNSETSIHYCLPIHSYVRLKILNSLGQEVEILVNEQQSPGYHSIHWKAEKQGSGLYFLLLEADDFSQMRKMLLLR